MISPTCELYNKLMRSILKCFNIKMTNFKRWIDELHVYIYWTVRWIDELHVYIYWILMCLGVWA